MFDVCDDNIIHSIEQKVSRKVSVTRARIIYDIFYFYNILTQILKCVCALKSEKEKRKNTRYPM